MEEMKENEENLKTESVNFQEIAKPKFCKRKKSLDSKSEIINCVLCFDCFPDTVLMECGHGGICFRCGVKLLKLKGKCPLCRENVTLILKIDVMSQYGNFIKVVDSIDTR